MPLSNYLPSSRISQSGVVANTAGRPASPYAGQVIYQLDTKQTLVYNGSAWVMIADLDTPPALELIATTSVSDAAYIQLDGCFSSTYITYRVSVNIYSTSTSGRYCHAQLCVAGAPTTSGYYSKSLWQDIAGSGATFADYDIQTTKYCLGPIGYANTGEGSYDFDLHYPYANRPTRMNGTGSGLMAGSYYIGTLNNGLQTSTTSFDGIRILPTASNIHATLHVYGYRNAI